MGNKILFILSIVLGLLWLLISLAPKRPWPGRQATFPSLPLSPSLQPQTLRVRFVNANMMPLGMPIAKKTKSAIKKGIFEQVDVVLFQEIFYRPWWMGIDPLKALAKHAPHVHLVRPAHILPAFTYTSSGLACATLPPWKAKCVGFQAFPKCGIIDGLSEKGVAIFEISDGQRSVRLATTHLQASYVQFLKNKDNKARVKQFKQAASFAKTHGAILLGGDINTHDTKPLKDMTAWVEDMGGAKLVDDGACSGRAIFKSTHGWRTDDRLGVRLDHGWILDRSKCKQVHTMHTNAALTEHWSDHAALDVSLILS